MLRYTSIISGLALLALGVLLAVPAAEAQQAPAIETRTLVNQRVEELPQGPLCWDVRRGSLASGSKSPATGSHAHGLVLSNVVDGTERLAYDGGPSLTIGPGQGVFIGQDNWHVHESVGATPRTNVNFELSCQRQPSSLGNSGAIPGVQPVPYQVQLRERRWPVGAQTPVHQLSGTTTTYVLEGTIAQASLAGVTRYGPGQLYLVPPGVTSQNTSVGDTPARTLDVDLWPAGQERSRTLTGVTLPSPAPGALPRTGNALPWVAPIAVLLGLVLLAAGIGMRRAKA